MPNLLTVVIPVYDRAEIVGRTLESLAAQTAPAFDVVLVDNGSSDGTLKVLEHWGIRNSTDARPVRVLLEPKPGACNARNLGLRAVNTPRVLFFDSDDVMLPEHIARVLAGIEANPEADILGWNVRIQGVGIKKFAKRHFMWNTLFEGAFATQRWCARTSLIRDAGGWNPEVRLWNDIELGMRMLAKNPSIVHLGDDITVEVYPQEVSISTNVTGDYLERMEAPLKSMASHLPAEASVWPEYVRAIVAGNTRRGASPEVADKARALMRRIVDETPSTFHKMLLRSVYHFRRLGGRGQNHILRLLLGGGKVI